MNIQSLLNICLISLLLPGNAYAWSLDEAVNEGKRAIMTIVAGQERIEKQLAEINKKLDEQKCECKADAE
jgi:hypothetical protein